MRPGTDHGGGELTAVCGIFGAVSRSGSAVSRPEVLDRIARGLHHRGPDGNRWVDLGPCALGATRLRIIDVDPRADQPYTTPDRSRWLVCNGEIYNAGDLRRRYPDYPFGTRADVEPILPLVGQRDLDGVAELDGMFALAVWDATERTLALARDRAGEKPLFYTEVGDELWFASEVAALLEHPGVSRELDPVALGQYLSLGYVLEPRTMFASIRSVPAGTVRVIGRDVVEERRYWHPLELAVAPQPAEDRARRLTTLVETAVAKQCVSDRPVGVFTSGGLDSSILTVLAARMIGPQKVRSFSAWFSQQSYDESPWAERCAASAGTLHSNVPCDGPELGLAFEEVTARLAEPIADPAILPTFLLARAASEHVAVVLSGEGADELFGGYPTYLGHRLAPGFARLPRAVRGLAESLARRIPPSKSKVSIEFLLKKFLESTGDDWVARHQRWFGIGLAPARGGRVEGGGFGEIGEAVRRFGPLAGAMLLDYGSYLRDDLLVKVDRATMLNSIEGRAPYLDRDLTAFALSLPADVKVRRLTTKWLLKQVARGWLPGEIITRRKRGFSVPVSTWINNGLRAETDRLLERGRLERQAILDPEDVHRRLAEHRSERVNHARPLWAAIILQRWIDRWRPDLA